MENTQHSDAADHKLDAKSVREFGGPMGVIAIMLGSHFVLYYLWISWRFHQGALLYPHGFSDIIPFFSQFLGHIINSAMPTWSALAIYGSFLALQLALATWLPGVKIKGLPIPSQGNRKLVYKCNGIWAWYITLVLVVILQLTGLFSLTKMGL